ncbi:DNA repair protein RecO [Glaciecola punicea ACAM 611]|jgi:DNA repair protein RecO (recombination protein O)|uniref:DNA repair protein RecO n=1 Tax=Glaciecola punicea ACAM 611 TaxID=1121923 RepID=H5TDB9_9ALTE|nr:DNA repair protein RecO [Glaciecola punicea]OFA30112.1 DNA repair protein RecO [Glaciecola punicea]GAB56296.1 DNA repair protein RecO [Glaciecola punicea ACAM 611]
MHNRQLLSGYVLHKRPYRETSLLVDFFSLEYGRVSAVAKGARGNSKSDRKSLLQPFQKLEFELIGRSQLKNLGRVEALQGAVKVRQSGLYCGFYINEILSRALQQEEPVEEVFTHYEKTLDLIANVDNNALGEFEPILREFEFTLLLALGYLPDFSVDAQSGADINENALYSFNPQIGFSPCGEDQKRAIKGEYIRAIANGNYGDKSQPHIKQIAKFICRTALVEVIGPKPIKSRELFR